VENPTTGLGVALAARDVVLLNTRHRVHPF
jgi:hypothetical protein